MDAESLTYEKVLHLIQMQGVELEKLRQQFAEERAAREAEDKKRRDEEAKRRDEEAKRLAEIKAESEKWRVEAEKRREAREADDKKQRDEAAKRFAEREAADKARWEKDVKRMKHLNELYGGVSKTLGQQAEQFFQKALKNAKFLFGGIAYNQMTTRLTRILDQLQDEFDIVLHNGSYVAVIEVKHRFRLSDLHVLIDRKLPNFRTMCPEYCGGKTINLGVAGFSFDDGVVEEALSRGIGVLSKDGKHVHFEDANLKAY